MQVITPSEFQALTEKATIIQQGPFGPKVYLDSQHQTLKLFYRQESWKRRLFPQAYRFIQLAKKLAKKNITALTPIAHYYYPDRQIDIVTYPWMEGASLREFANQGDFSKLDDYARFLATLHEKHIYFRGGHIGNVLLLEDQRFALIDICNLKFYMNFRRRVKNIAYIANHWVDRAVFQTYGRERFAEMYLSAAGFSEREKQLFWEKFGRGKGGLPSP